MEYDTDGTALTSVILSRSRPGGPWVAYRPAAEIGGPIGLGAGALVLLYYHRRGIGVRSEHADPLVEEDT